MEGKINGMWSIRLEVIYKEKYNEEFLSNLMYLIEKWIDVVKVEE